MPCGAKVVHIEDAKGTKEVVGRTKKIMMHVVLFAIKRSEPFGLYICLHLIESLKCTWSHPGMHRRCKERCKERWSHPPYYVPVHLSNQRFDEMQSADASLMQRTLDIKKKNANGVENPSAV